MPLNGIPVRVTEDDLLTLLDDCEKEEPEPSEVCAILAIFQCKALIEIRNLLEEIRDQGVN